MEFSSHYQIDIPDVDVLTYVFGVSTPGDGSFVYLDAKTPAQGFRKHELETYVKRLAGGLHEMKKIKNDDVILAYTDNSVWYPVIVLGAICAGGIFTGANPGYTSIELSQHLTVSGATCIFTDSKRIKAAIEAAGAAGLPRTSIVLLDSDGESAFGDIQSIHDLLISPHPWEIIKDPQVLSEKVAVLNFSSGTTGNPKASPPVELMLGESDLVPQYDLSSVEPSPRGGAPLQPEQSRKLEAVFGNGRVRSRQGWGMTEATMAVTLFAPDEFDPLHKGVGYLLANMQMKIVADNGSQVGYDEEGEALVRGPNIFKGYYKDESASQQAFDEMGWMKTGDIVTIQSSGLVTVVNRKKVAINT
ncbi:hypothetical protein LZL87_012978 [Fusarium oxysporum]|nr:hypothetical protein LZL87_012978 [Fusarium oxysporum]